MTLEDDVESMLSDQDQSDGESVGRSNFKFKVGGLNQQLAGGDSTYRAFGEDS